ncbi:peptidoglycan-binding domain-containing protein [Virgibacillus halophilus]|uniref:Peptidoglycan-binding domain-containing protein n=1 Tax=Tigheibacillus halophilus TaxID=361280 RepID=A0ABU5C7S6_9BACI|nr:peptidoglycan-binding domain-containing protein [Virgibacillus halophilus]
MAKTIKMMMETLQINKQISKLSRPLPPNKQTTLPEASLQKGDKGEKVADLQQVLKKIGYPIKKTDIFDTDTTWAITDFQLQQKKIGHHRHV